VRPTANFEFPPEQQQTLAQARRLEWWTLAYIGSGAVLLYLVMGSSQAMRTSFFEELISLVPAAAFLVCAPIALRAASPTYPYGLHGAVSIGYLVASLSLIAMGLFLLIEAAAKILSGERTTIGGFSLFGHMVWGGWPMLAVLLYTGVPSIFLGRAKLRLAPRIHDKILFADAHMMKADWMAELAAGIGVLGVGLGWWWMDPLAAGLVSLDIIKDGATNLRVAVDDLIERRPMRTDRSGPEPIMEELKRWAEGLEWVDAAEVRLREVGHVFFAEVFVRPRTSERLPERIAGAVEEAKRLNWRLHDVTITALQRMDAAPSGR